MFLFTDADRHDNSHDKDTVILPEEEFLNATNSLNGLILFDKNLCSDHVATLVGKNQCKNVCNPCMEWKAQKNPTEIKNMQKGHMQDAIAVCEMLAYLSTEDISNSSEHDDVGKKLTGLRAKR